MFLRAVVPACIVALVSISPPALAQDDETIECRSSGYKYTECEAPFRQPQLVQQLSDSECVANRSWGFKRDAGVIWVSGGCAAIFADSQDRYSQRDRDDRESRDNRDREDNYTRSRERGEDRRDRESRQEVVECRSRGYAFTRCDASWNSARLIEQLSDTSCVEGENWGLDDDGLWVDKGCGGRFAGE
jgi:hypothetical protein